MTYSPDFFHQEKTTIRNFEVVDKIYSYKTTNIFKVRDHSGHYFAAKILSQEASPQSQLRFKKEVAILEKLNSTSGVPKIHTSGEIDRNPYYIMDYIDGISLKNYIKKNIPEKKALEIIKQITQIVNEIHNKRILHCDLSPKNILLKDNAVYVIDFGIALAQDESPIWKQGQCLGTPSYIPLEQANGEVSKVGPWSDIFSLSCILHHMIVGVPPFQGKRDLETLGNLANNSRRSLREYDVPISDAVIYIIEKSLHPNIGRRYQNIESFLTDIHTALDLIVDTKAKTVPLTKRKRQRTKLERQKPLKKALKNEPQAPNASYLFLCFCIGLVLACCFLIPVFIYKKQQSNLPIAKDHHSSSLDKKNSKNNKQNQQNSEHKKAQKHKKQEWHVPVKISSKFYARWEKQGEVWVGTVDRPFGLMWISDFPHWKNYVFKADFYIQEGLLGIFVRNFEQSAQFPNFLGQMGVQNFKKIWFSVTARAKGDKIVISLDNTNRSLVRYNRTQTNPGILGFGITTSQPGIPALIYVKNMRIRKIQEE